MVKNLHWLGRSRAIIQGFAKPVRAELGYQLYRIQQGLMPTDYKPMSSIGAGTLEIRVHRPHEYRVIYMTKLQERICILHAFEKKTQKTSKRDIEIARRNYQVLVNRIKNLKVRE